MRGNRFKLFDCDSDDYLTCIICRIHRAIHLQRLDRCLARGRLKRTEAQEEYHFDLSSPFQPTTQEVAMMNELDENGWAPIHQAAFHGYVKSVEKFIKVRQSTETTFSEFSERTFICGIDAFSPVSVFFNFQEQKQLLKVYSNKSTLYIKPTLTMLHSTFQ